MEQQEIWIKSTMDGSMQPSLLYRASGEEKRPLMVGLHSWSHDRFNMVNRMVPYAEKYNFNLLLPEFRGAKWLKTPTAVRPAAPALHGRTLRMLWTT